MDYAEFLESKRIKDIPTGLEIGESDINPMLFDFQRDIVRWAIRRGRAAIWADCGLGKTPMQLEWAKQISSHTGLPVLIFAPLAVSQQTMREGDKFGVKVTVCREQCQISPGVNITNYEMMKNFNADAFGGIVLDESSILKSQSGKYRTELINKFRDVQFKLACTATPAPNDHMELANHAEFLGVMTRSEMLSMFFVHDGGETSKWRLKGHAESEFWKWICTWAVLFRKPSDLGYDDSNFVLPKLIMHEHVIEYNKPLTGELFSKIAETLSERQKARRETIELRTDKVAELINDIDDTCIIWCNLNDESSIAASKTGGVEISGSDTMEQKSSRMMRFSAGEIKTLITKPSIAGFGMNWQHCSNMVFLGLNDSYEQLYQAVRRCWRFGQKKPVNVHIVTTTIEGRSLENIKRKEADAERMQGEMVKSMAVVSRENIKGMKRQESIYMTDKIENDTWTLYNGDCVEVMSKIDADTIGYSIFSPPFASLYTYSNSDRDMGNTKNDDEFLTHFGFAVEQLYRIMKPGRLVSFHCMQLPMSKQNYGYIGLRDFRGELIRLFQSKGWIYHSEVCIWKDPVVAMQRTKALGLLWKQIKKDSSMCRQGIADYVVTMRKHGENDTPISNTPDEFPVKLWQNYASPVWMDINPSETLQKNSAREDKDERHICPLQLEVIRRCLKLWSKEGDMVLSPFAGIGSEGVEAVKSGRKFIGIELKPSYFEQAARNLNAAGTVQMKLL